MRHALPLRVENSDTVADPALSPIGLEQARRLAAWLGCEPITRIVSSPKRRAVETATPLAETLGLDVEVIQEFSEIDRSSDTYIPVEELRKENHPIYQKMKKQAMGRPRLHGSGILLEGSASRLRAAEGKLR